MDLIWHGLCFPSLNRLPNVLCSELGILGQPVEEFLDTNALGDLDSMNFEDMLLAGSHLKEAIEQSATLD